MTDSDAERPSLQEAADLVRNEPALGADSPDPHDDNRGTDDDATSPDTAVSNEE